MAWSGNRLDEASVAPVREGSVELYEVLDTQDPAATVDLDKAWHGLHWLLTGRADPHPAPLSDAILGGEEIGEDLGYGPSYLLTPDRVRAVATALEALDEAELRARADPTAMDRAELYPGIWGEEEGLFDLMLLPSFQDLRDFYAEAARQGQVVVHGLS